MPLGLDVSGNIKTGFERLLQAGRPELALTDPLGIRNMTIRPPRPDGDPHAAGE